MGIEKIKAVGEKFDPRFHEAVHLDDSEGEDEVVLEEVQSGWMIGDEVIRPASVKVTKVPKE
jgi:molecular chaperone GrpE